MALPGGLAARPRMVLCIMLCTDDGAGWQAVGVRRGEEKGGNTEPLYSRRGKEVIEVVIGWGLPMESFFARVARGECEILWTGSGDKV